MRKRVLIMVCGLILLINLFTICYTINACRRAYWDYQLHTSYGFSDIYFLNAEDGWLLGTSKYIFITHDGGITWEKRDAPTRLSLTQIQFVSEQVGWLLGGAEIYKSIDGGSTWILQTADLDNVNTFFFVNETTGWAVSWTSTVFLTLFITNDGGNNWQSQVIFPYSPSASQYILDLYFVNESHGWFLYQFNSGSPLFPYSQIYSTNDSGESWSPHPIINTTSLQRIYFTDQYNGWTIGEQGSIFYTNDSSCTWINQSIPIELTLENIYFLNNSFGWICGKNGTILHTIDMGDAWISLSNSSLTVDFSDIFFQNAVNGWAVGSTPEPYISSNGGSSWQAYQITVFSSSNSWIWVLIGLNIIFFVVGTWSIYNSEKIKRSRLVQFFKNSLVKVEEALFNTQTTNRKISTVLLILCLLYVFSLIAILIHELGHALATILLGCYTKHIEVNLNLSGATWVGNFSPFQSGPFAIIIIFASGLIGTLVIGIILMKISLGIKRNKRFFILLTLIISYSFIIDSLISFVSGLFFNVYSDAFSLSYFLNIPIYVIPLILIPAFIVSTFYILKIFLGFYKDSLNSQKAFIYLVLISIAVFFCISYFIFPLMGPIYTIIIS